MAGRQRNGRAWAILASAAMLFAVMPMVPGVSASNTIQVSPGDDVDAKIATASPGDTVLLKAGVYTQAINVTVPDITLTGEGAGLSIIEGQITPDNRISTHGISIRGENGVTVRDLTVRNFEGNGINYMDVDGFHVEGVSVENNGPYGVNARRSSNGGFFDSVAFGHADSGFYLGENSDCACVIDNVHAHDNLIGYSGTGAGNIVIKNSLWENNAAGIVPNVLPSEPELQIDLEVHDNIIRDNNNQAASDMWHFSGGFHVPAGLGIVIAGGIDDHVHDNEITGHDLAGVAMVWLFTQPSFNRIVDNVLDNPDGTDILWDAGGVNNCFEGNTNPNGPVTFDAGPVWNTAGLLPDCDTPNAGPPWPGATVREVFLLAFNCDINEPDTLEDRCHGDHLG